MFRLSVLISYYQKLVANVYEKKAVILKATSTG